MQDNIIYILSGWWIDYTDVSKYFSLQQLFSEINCMWDCDPFLWTISKSCCLLCFAFCWKHLHANHSHPMTSSACPHGWPLPPYLSEKNLHDPRSFYISGASPGLSYHRPWPCRGSGPCCPRPPPHAALPPTPPDSFLRDKYLIEYICHFYY